MAILEVRLKDRLEVRLRDRKLLFESKWSPITSNFHMYSPDCDAILNTVQSSRGTL